MKFKENVWNLLLAFVEASVVLSFAFSLLYLVGVLFY